MASQRRRATRRTVDLELRHLRRATAIALAMTAWLAGGLGGPVMAQGVGVASASGWLHTVVVSSPDTEWVGLDETGSGAIVAASSGGLLLTRTPEGDITYDNAPGASAVRAMAVADSESGPITWLADASGRIHALRGGEWWSATAFPGGEALAVDAVGSAALASGLSAEEHGQLASMTVGGEVRTSPVDPMYPRVGLNGIAMVGADTARGWIGAGWSDAGRGIGASLVHHPCDVICTHVMRMFLDGPPLNDVWYDPETEATIAVGGRGGIWLQAPCSFEWPTGFGSFDFGVEVNAVDVCPNGDVVVGGHDGELTVFGQHWERLRPPTRATITDVLCSASDQSIWATTDRGHILRSVRRTAEPHAVFLPDVHRAR